MKRAVCLVAAVAVMGCPRRAPTAAVPGDAGAEASVTTQGTQLQTGGGLGVPRVVIHNGSGTTNIQIGGARANIPNGNGAPPAAEE